MSESGFRFQTCVKYTCMKRAVEERQCTPHQILVFAASKGIRVRSDIGPELKGDISM